MHSNHKLHSDKEIDWSEKENQSSLSQLMIEDLSGKNLLRNRINPESAKVWISQGFLLPWELA